METPHPLPSDRSFGWTFTGVFALVAFFQPWVLALAALTALVTLVRAHWLAPFKRAWMKFGELLHHVVSPVVLGVIFYGRVHARGLRDARAGARRHEAALRARPAKLLGEARMRVLGISAYYHDSAAALLRDGVIIAAAQEERFTRKKHDSSFPHEAIRSCLESTGTRPGEIDLVAFYDKPFLKFDRLLETYLAFAPRGFASFRQALPVWVKDKLFQRRTLAQELKAFDPDQDWDKKLIFSEHHLSHAASAFYPSPFERAAVLTLDGVGEWTTSSLALGNGRDLKVLREIRFPHSLGLLYSAFTYYTGFKVNSGEYKVMGLAPYGEPRFADVIKENLIDIKEDGSFRLNLEYFEYCTGLTMTNGNFERLFGGPARKREQRLTQREMDLAASIQAVTEEVMLKLALGVAKETGEKNLCLAGGVALNCVANGKLLRKRYFERLWLQPAAGDAGGALGAALVAYHLFKSQPRSLTEKQDAMRGGYLGPQFTQSDVEARLRRAGAVFEVLPENELLDACATLARGRQGARLVPGPHGVRPARARRALDSRRRALAEHAEDAQPQAQGRASRSGRSRPPFSPRMHTDILI